MLLLLFCLLSCGSRDTDGDGYPVPVDCDDSDPAIHPGTEEVCANGIDDDCDGLAAGCGPAGTMSLSDADAKVVYAARDGAILGGQALAGVPDARGDGQAAVAVGDDWDRTGMGSVWLVDGPLTGEQSLDDLAPLLTGDEDDVVGGELLGAELSGDAYVDLLVLSRHAEEPDSVLLFAGPLPSALSPGDASAVLTLDSSSWLELVAPGDLDGDGAADLLLKTGTVWVVPGPLAGEIDATTGLELSGEVASAVASQDLDGDGALDVVVGSSWAGDTGHAYVLLDPVTASRGLEDADADLRGAWVGGQLGSSIATADTDGDGYGEVAVAAPSDFSDGEHHGRTYLFGGRGYWWDRDADDADAVFYDEPGTWYKGAVMSPGDLDGDGLADLVLQGDCWDRGCACLQLGPLQGAHPLVYSDALLVGEGRGDEAGDPIVALGDHDGDGTDDLLVGAWYNFDGGPWTGAMYLVKGGPGF